MIVEGNIYFISDMHLLHKNILKFEPERPFKDISHMTEAMIDNWNSVVVDKGDVVFVLGDFCFGSRKQTEYILSRLNGIKRLIKGNHDSHSSVVKAKGWEWVKDYYELTYDTTKIVLFHYPILSFHKVHRGAVHIHGHVHGKLKGEKEGKWGKMMDAWVGNTDYKPIHIDKCLSRLDKLPMVCFDDSHIPNNIK